jgi:hypothetical protein
MLIDSTNAYFVTDATSAGEDIAKVGLTGGPAVVLASDPNGFTGGFAIDGSSVYWAELGNPGVAPDGGVAAPDGGVMSAPIAGGTAKSIVSGTSASAVAVDDANVYWLDTAAGALDAAPKGGGQTTVLASNQTNFGEIVLDATNVYWSQNEPVGIGRVQAVPKSGGAPTQLAYYECTIGSMVVHGAYLYWACSVGDIMRTPVAGGASTALAVGQNAIDGDIAVGDAGVYWMTLDSSLMKLPLTDGVLLQGATPTVLYTPSPYTNVDTPAGIAVDSMGLYVLLYGGSLAKITPP